MLFSFLKTKHGARSHLCCPLLNRGKDTRHPLAFCQMIKMPYLNFTCPSPNSTQFCVCLQPLSLIVSPPLRKEFSVCSCLPSYTKCLFALDQQIIKPISFSVLQILTRQNHLFTASRNLFLRIMPATLRSIICLQARRLSFKSQ